MFIGIPKVNNLMAADNCLNVNASWTPITGQCSNLVQYMISLLSSSNTIGPVVTSDTSYNFNNAVMLTGDISVRVTAFIENTIGTSTQVTTQPSLTSKRFIILHCSGSIFYCLLSALCLYPILLVFSFKWTPLWHWFSVSTEMYML